MLFHLTSCLTLRALSAIPKSIYVSDFNNCNIITEAWTDKHHVQVKFLHSLLSVKYCMQHKSACASKDSRARDANTSLSLCLGNLSFLTHVLYNSSGEGGWLKSPKQDGYSFVLLVCLTVTCLCIWGCVSRVMFSEPWCVYDEWRGRDITFGHCHI